MPGTEASTAMRQARARAPVPAAPARPRRSRRALAAVMLGGQQRQHRGARQVGAEQQARGGAAQAHHRAVAHVHVHGGRRLLDAHHRRPAVAPHRHAHGVAERARQLADQRRGQAHRVVLLQADQPQLHGQRAQAVAARLRVLLDQPELAEAHQVGVGLGRASCRPRAPGPSAPSAGPGAPARAAAGRRPRRSGCRAAGAAARLAARCRASCGWRAWHAGFYLNECVRH